MAEIQKAMNAFCDLLEDIPGIRSHRPTKGSGSTNAGWYAARAHYLPEELGGLSVTTFTAAVRAEGVTDCHPGANPPLHLHPLLNTCDVYGHGKPTRIAHSDRDVRQPEGSLPNSERVASRSFAIPWFKHYRPEIIEQHAEVFRKVAENYRDLLEHDQGDPPAGGAWGLTPV